MRRPFLRVYLWVSLAILAVSAVWAIGARRELTVEVERRLEFALSPGVDLARDRLRGRPGGPHGARRRPPRLPDDAGRERLVETLSEAWGVDVAVRAPDAIVLPERDARRADRGEIVLSRTAAAGTLLVAELNEQEWLVIGPLPNAPGQRLVLQTLLRVAFALGLIGGVLFLALGPYERRLSRLGDAAAALGEGRWSTRVDDDRDDAIGDVAAAFDGMAARIETVVERQRELFAGVSHELRTPLARLLFLLEELEDAEDPELRARHVSRATASVEEIDALVGELLTLARADASARELVVVRLRDAVERAVDSVPAARALGVRIEGDATARGDVALTQRALTNVLTNATRHAATKVTVRIEASDDAALVHVDDDGAGIPAADRERVFEAFTQLDASRGERGAAGLGLAIVARCMSAQHGRATAGASPEGGARLTLRFAPGQGAGQVMSQSSS